MTILHRFMIVSALIAMAQPSVAADATPGRGHEADVVSKVNGEAITLKDFDLALFWDQYTLIQKEMMDNLISEQLVRQEVSRKGISVGPGDVDEFLADLDRNLKATDKTKSLADYLVSQGMSLTFFRRKTEAAIGLCRLAGGQGRVYEETQKPAVKEKMNALLVSLRAAARIETDPGKLETGVAAMVGGERVSVEEVGQVARMVIGAELKKKQLKDLQILTVARQELRRRQLELAPADLDFEFELLCSQRAGGIDGKSVTLGDVLRSRGQDLKLLRRQTDFQVLAILAKMVRAEVTDESVRQLFASDPARFGDGVPKASHIMFKTVDAQGRALSPQADLKVRNRALALREQLLAGEDFAAMAGKHSDDKETADKGGMLGFLDKARIIDPVVAAAYGLKVGEVSQPVKGTNGWHLVKVMEVKRVAFEGVKSEVRAELFRDLSLKLLSDLITKAKVEAGPVKL